MCGTPINPMSLSSKDINNFIKSINYNNIINYVNSLILILKSNHYLTHRLTHSAFKSQDKFAENIISCKTILIDIDDDPINFSDKFIHINIDYSNINQVNSAIQLATERAFQSRFIPPITGIIKGKAFGEMLVLSPTGLSRKYQFDGDYAYRGNATFRNSDNNQSDTFSCFVYYFAKCFNPIRHSSGVNSSNVTFITEVDNKTYLINNNDLYNRLYNDIANKLQYKYLNKMTDKNKMNNIYFSDILPGSDMLKISTTGPKQSYRAHFSDYGVSVAYKIDEWSEYVGQGEYPKNSEAFPKAVYHTFDGIAIDANTRVVIYEHEYFKGKILLDAKGPEIINNVLFKNPTYNHCMPDIFPDTKLQENFPINVRVWSDSNMQPWSKGSVKILSNTLN